MALHPDTFTQQRLAPVRRMEFDAGALAEFLSSDGVESVGPCNWIAVLAVRFGGAHHACLPLLPTVLPQHACRAISAAIAPGEAPASVA